MIFTVHEMNKLRDIKPKSGYKGRVTKSRDKLRADISYRNKDIYLGVYETREQAQMAADRAAELADKGQLTPEHRPIIQDYVKRNYHKPNELDAVG